MASRITTFIIVLIVAGTLVAGLIVGAQRDEADGPVDLIITNGRVYTADGSGTFAEAVAVRGNKILRVGSQPRDQAPSPAADDDRRRARRDGAAGIQRQPRPRALGRVVARAPRSAGRDLARVDPDGDPRLRRGPSRSVVDSRPRLVLRAVSRRTARRGSSSTCWCPIGRRTSSPTTGTPAGPTARRSRRPASRARRRARATARS